jgi:hypothetical protein
MSSRQALGGDSTQSEKSSRTPALFQLKHVSGPAAGKTTTLRATEQEEEVSPLGDRRIEARPPAAREALVELTICHPRSPLRAWCG